MGEEVAADARPSLRVPDLGLRALRVAGRRDDHHRGGLLRLWDPADPRSDSLPAIAVAAVC